MAIVQETEVASAEANDSYGVTVWQHRKSVELSTAAAREYAQEILEAAAEADRLSQEDVAAAFGGIACQTYSFDIDQPPTRPENWRASE